MDVWKTLPRLDRGMVVWTCFPSIRPPFHPSIHPRSLRSGHNTIRHEHLQRVGHPAEDEETESGRAYELTMFVVE